jgi:hypothetical protein
MAMTAVNSSMIQAVDYDPDTQDFTVKFTNGKTLVFQDVPQSKYDAFMAAPSQGKYFHGHIKSHVSRKVR